MWNHAKITSDILFWYIESMHITVLIRCKIDFSRIRVYDYVDKVIRGLLCGNYLRTSFSWVRVQFILVFLPMLVFLWYLCGHLQLVRVRTSRSNPESYLFDSYFVIYVIHEKMNMMFRSRLCVSIFRCFLLLAANSPKLYETTVTGFIWPRFISQKSMYSLASPFSWHFFSSCLLRTP